PIASEASTIGPAVNGAASATDHVPSGATVAVPAAPWSTRRLTSAPVTPVPPTCVVVATRGRFSAGAGGRPTTVTVAEKALVIPATVCRAPTLLPAVSAGTARLHEPLGPTIVVPELTRSMKTSTVPPAVPVPPTRTLAATSGVLITGGGGTATTICGADGVLSMPSTVCVAVTCWAATSGATTIETLPLLPMDPVPLFTP